MQSFLSSSIRKTCYNLVMSNLPSCGLILLASVLLAFLQLPLGTLLLLCHSLISSKKAHKKTKALVSSYIFGVFLSNFLLLASACFLIATLLPSRFMQYVFSVGLFFALLFYALFAICFYYRPSGFNANRKPNSTELWIPRRFARFLHFRAKATSNVFEAFSLGVTTALAELPFSAPLLSVSALGIMNMKNEFAPLSAIFCAGCSVLPSLIFKFFIRNGKTLIDVQRFRLRHKTFFRLFSGFGFFALAVFLFAFFILGMKGKLYA